MAETQHRRREIGLRSAFVGIAVVLTVLALLATAGLIFSAWWVGYTGGELVLTARSIRAAEELELRLLVSNRERYLERIQPGAGHAARADAAEDDLNRLIARARSYVQTDEENHLLDDLARAVEAYRHVYEDPAVEMLDPVTYFQQTVQEVDAAIRTSERFIQINIAQADAVIAQAERWRRAAELSGIILAVLVPLVMIGALFFARRRLYRPFIAIEEAIARYGGGDLAARAPTEGPTDLQEMALRFNDMADALAAQNAARLSFLASVAHDLRNPLAALKATAALQKREVAPEKARDRADLILRQVERLNRMVEDLLDVSRVEAGHLDLRLEERDLREQVREVTQLFEGTSERHRLICELPEEPVSMCFDPVRIGQVLANLVSNAIKYSPAGGDVRIRLEADLAEARVAVSDQGIGMTPAEQARLFEPFRRGKRVVETIPGVGLGLSVANRLVLAHGGRIEVASEAGRGSTFMVHLPRK